MFRRCDESGYLFHVSVDIYDFKLTVDDKAAIFAGVLIRAINAELSGCTMLVSLLIAYRIISLIFVTTNSSSNIRTYCLVG